MNRYTAAEKLRAITAQAERMGVSTHETPAWRVLYGRTTAAKVRAARRMIEAAERAKAAALVADEEAWNRIL